MKSYHFLVVALLVTLGEFSSSVAAVRGAELPNALWETDTYTNYPRNYGPPAFYAIRNGSATKEEVPAVFYLGSYNCGYRLSIHAFNAQTGRELWSHHRLPHPSYCAFGSQPPVADNKIFWLSDASPPSVHAIDALSGDPLWETKVGQGSHFRVNDPTAVGNRVATAVDDKVFGLSSTNGSTLWLTILKSTENCNFLTAIRVEAEDAVDLLICSGNSGYITALNISDGRKIWSYHFDKRFSFVGAPQIAQNYSTLVFENAPVSSFSDGDIFALGALDGQLKWNITFSRGKNSDQPNEFGLDGDVLVYQYTVTTGHRDSPDNKHVMHVAGRNVTNGGSLLWDISAAERNAFGGVWVDGGEVFVLTGPPSPGMEEIQVLSSLTGGKKWGWEGDWCAKHHDIGVACGLSRPFAKDGVAYLSYGGGSHDHILMFAITKPQE